MNFVIVTGMSGAGKSTALRFLEDMGFYCIDNLPPSLAVTFAELCVGSGIEKVALGIDIRGGRLFQDCLPMVNRLEERGFTPKLLFFDASDEILLKRYKETRRSHPLGDRLIDGISSEREILAPVKQRAHYIVDTSRLLTRQLKETLVDILAGDGHFRSLIISVSSFGFKYGIPTDSDLVYDVRFIPNPFYVPELKALTGNDKAVRDFVMDFPVAKGFLERLQDMTDFLIPHYINEGKNQLVISIGCTGGKHRSVTLANELFSHLLKAGHSVVINHRDIDIK